MQMFDLEETLDDFGCPDCGGSHESCDCDY